MSTLLIVFFLVAPIFIIVALVKKYAELGTPRAPIAGVSPLNPNAPVSPHRFGKRQRLVRIATGLAVIGFIFLIYAYGKRPTPYDKLIPAAGRVTRVVTVSERLVRNPSAAPSSVNPFTPHDWIELTVEPTAPASLHDNVTWRINTIQDDDTLRSLQGTNITAKVESLSPYAKAYEVTTASGQPFSTYDDIAVFERRGMIFLFCAAGFFFLTALVLSIQSRNTDPETA